MAGVPVHDTVALTGSTPRRVVAHRGGHLVAAAADRRADDGVEPSPAPSSRIAATVRGTTPATQTRPAGVHGGRPPRPASASSTGTQSATSTREGEPASVG